MQGEEDKKLYAIIYSYSYGNRKLIKRYKDCTCLYCGKAFPYTAVKNWVADEPELTAICPYCHIDAIVPTHVENRVEKYTLTEDIRQAIKKEYF